MAIGAAAIFARFALGGAGPLAVSALRLGIATIAIVIIARSFTRLGARKEIAFALAGLALALHFATWIASLDYTSVAVSTLLVTTTPIWTEAFDAVRNRHPPSPTFSIALACALGGVAAIATARGLRPPPMPGNEPLGDALALCGSLAIGAYLLIVRDAGRAGAARITTRAIVTRTYGWATLSLAVGAAVAHQRPPAISDAASWGGIVAMALISQLLGHTALNAALADFTPSVIALTTLLEPPIAAIFAALIFHETLSWQAAIGGVLILAAVGIVLRDARNSGSTQTPAVPSFATGSTTETASGLGPQP